MLHKFIKTERVEKLLRCVLAIVQHRAKHAPLTVNSAHISSANRNTNCTCGVCTYAPCLVHVMCDIWPECVVTDEIGFHFCIPFSPGNCSGHYVYTCISIIIHIHLYQNNKILKNLKVMDTVKILERMITSSLTNLRYKV